MHPGLRAGAEKASEANHPYRGRADLSDDHLALNAEQKEGIPERIRIDAR